jgi:hypothetical protein
MHADYDAPQISYRATISEPRDNRVTRAILYRHTKKCARANGQSVARRIGYPMFIVVKRKILRSASLLIPLKFGYD